jgi:hypothetical protein
MGATLSRSLQSLAKCWLLNHSGPISGCVHYKIRFSERILRSSFISGLWLIQVKRIWKDEMTLVYNGIKRGLRFLLNTGT